MSHLVIPGVKEIYEKIILSKIIPFFGNIITGDSKMHEYFAESVKNFPTQEKFCEIMKNAGFKDCKYENLEHGIVAIHQGIKN